MPFLAACAAAAWTCTPPLVGRAAPQCRLPLHARVWSAPRCAVDRFSVGTYTFTCATDCAAATCAITKGSENIGGTLPDVFDRLTCASKITQMCAHSARAVPGPVRICLGGHVCAFLRACVPCACVSVCAHLHLPHVDSRTQRVRAFHCIG